MEAIKVNLKEAGVIDKVFRVGSGRCPNLYICISYFLDRQNNDGKYLYRNFDVILEDWE
jgi:hypothetical protein